MAKALLLRYHPLYATLTDKVTAASIPCALSNTVNQVHHRPCTLSKLFSLLDDADLGPAAADAFLLLMSDTADILNRGCHADVRIMYRQRFFSENSAKLVQGFNAAPQGAI